MAKTGCPKQYGLRWEEGWYVQDTEDTDNKNDISNENHLMGSMNTSKLPPPVLSESDSEHSYLLYDVMT